MEQERLRQTWRKFERTVAALHRFRDQGATVTLNETIHGRELDVVVRFEHAGYRYLLLVECKKLGRPVNAEKMDAFVTKSRDLGANQAVMVSAAGFQRGALEVAARHSIGAFTLTELSKAWPSKSLSVPMPAISVFDLKLLPRFGSAWLAVSDRHLSTLRFGFTGGRQDIDLRELLTRGASDFSIEHLKVQRTVSLAFGDDAHVRSPLLPGGMISIRGVEVKAQVKSVPVKVPVNPPAIPLLEYRYANAATGETSVFEGSELPIGLDTVLTPGRFYRNVFGMSYKCEKVEGATATMVVFGMRSQHPERRIAVDAVRFTMDAAYAPMYVEVTDPSEERALAQRFEADTTPHSVP